MEENLHQNESTIPYLRELEDFKHYNTQLGIYLAANKVSKVLKDPQISPPEAPNNANAETKAKAEALRKEYFDMQERAYGLIALTLTKCDNLLEDLFKEDPTLQLGGDERPNGSKLLKAAKKYILSNKSGGLYSAYDHKLKCIRLNQFNNVGTMLKKMDNLYAMIDPTVAVPEETKIIQLGTALGKGYKDWMRNTAFGDGVTYAKLCSQLKYMTKCEAAEEESISKSATESSTSVKSKIDESKEEAANYSSEDDSHKRKHFEPRSILKNKYHRRFEYRRSNPEDRPQYRSRSRSPSGSFYRDNDRGRNRSQSRSPSRSPGRDKRRVRWSYNGTPERQQRDRTNSDHFANEIVQASKRENSQCYNCRGYGHHSKECPSKKR